MVIVTRVGALWGDGATGPTLFSVKIFLVSQCSRLGIDTLPIQFAAKCYFLHSTLQV